VAETIDYTKQPLPWSVMYPVTTDSATPDLGDATATPAGFRVAHRRSPASCRHEGNHHGQTFCRHCGTRVAQ
jgi:hypothetical protein